MRNLFWICILILAVFIFAVVFWRRSVPAHREEGQRRQSAQSNASLQNTNNVNQANVTSTHTNITVGSSLPATNATLKSITEKFIQQQQGPISFYGQCVDQNSNPVAGVDIKASVQQLSFDPTAEQMIGAKQIGIKFTSDINGRFEITGVAGTGFGIVLDPKDGYTPSLKSPKSFGQNSGSYENPVIFRLWKIGEKAQLVSGNKFWSIVPDGRVYTIDLLKGTKIESASAPGDIRISIVRPLEIKPRTPFDWSFSMEAIQGGVIQTKDEFMYLAPDSGYQSNYEITMNSTNSSWSKKLNGLQFFLKSRDGQVFGRFTFDLIPDYNNLSIFNVDWAVNPNGSRNLEPQ